MPGMQMQGAPVTYAAPQQMAPVTYADPQSMQMGPPQIMQMGPPQSMQMGPPQSMQMGAPQGMQMGAQSMQMGPPATYAAPAQPYAVQSTTGPVPSGTGLSISATTPQPVQTMSHGMSIICLKHGRTTFAFANELAVLPASTFLSHLPFCQHVSPVFLAHPSKRASCAEDLRCARGAGADHHGAPSHGGGDHPGPHLHPDLRAAAQEPSPRLIGFIGLRGCSERNRNWSGKSLVGILLASLCVHMLHKPF